MAECWQPKHRTTLAQVRWIRTEIDIFCVMWSSRDALSSASGLQCLPAKNDDCTVFTSLFTWTIISKRYDLVNPYLLWLAYFLFHHLLLAALHGYDNHICAFITLTRHPTPYLTWRDIYFSLKIRDIGSPPRQTHGRLLNFHSSSVARGNTVPYYAMLSRHRENLIQHGLEFLPLWLHLARTTGPWRVVRHSV